MTRKIITSYWAKPIPWRDFDWEAVYDDYDGGDMWCGGDVPPDPIGHGRTEAEAIEDLKNQCPDEDEDGLDTGNSTPISPAQLGAR